MRIMWFRSSLRIAGASFLIVGIAGCAQTSDPRAIVVPCDPMDPQSCPQDEGFAQFCSLADNSSCVNVCQGASALPGGCETDGQCGDGLTCDNDRTGGESTCECVPGSKDCVPAFTDIGGTPENPVVWEEKYTCVDNNGSCFAGGASDNNQPITFELVQDGKDVTGTVRAGPGEGDVFEGELCGNEFRWIDVTPGVQDPEQGCWTFTSNSFNKRSFVADDFDCVGSGTRGAGSTPPDIISCQDLGSASINYTKCPAPPPAAPQLPRDAVTP